MSHGFTADTRRKLIAKLDALVAAGRVTEDEARRLRAADDDDAFDAVAGEISARHAAARTADGE